MLFVNTNIATCGGNGPYGLVRNGALAIADGRIAWIGKQDEIPPDYDRLERCDLAGRLITPALIDCHTHIVHGGHRAAEFEKRLQGVSYEDIARQGGGILSTVTSTRAASVADLLAGSLPRVDALMAEGVATLEIKSGYGLDVETELNMLRAARKIEAERPIRVKTSFLGAHSVPPQYQGRALDYIDDICIPALKKAHAEGLVDAVDGFCEGIAFSAAEIERVFRAAKQLGLPVKLHAEQLSHSGGVALACKYGALSADHLEYASDDDAVAMAGAGTLAVLLPGAYYTVRETRQPPVESFRRHGVRMAVATDCNPGSSPMTSLLLAMNMACTLFGLTPEEGLMGVTANAAGALGLTDSGTLEPGTRADLAIWNVEHPAELSYRIAFNPLHERIFAGSACPRF